MSQAVKWSKELQEREQCVRTIRQARPAPIYLRFSVRGSVSVEADDAGLPRIKLDDGNWQGVETDKLLAFCRQIIATFADPAP